MKLSKSITGLVSSIALLGVLVSCGDNTQGQSSSSITDGEKPSTVTISFWHTFGKNTQDYLAQVIEEFHDLVLEHDGVNVTIETSYKGSYDDIQNNILMGFASGSYPNITVAYPDNVANYIYNSPKGREVLVNLDQWMSSPEVGFGTQEWLGDKSGSLSYGKDDFVEAFIEESSMYQQEGSYSLPFMKSSEVMFYNKQAFYTACKMYQPEGVNVDSTDAMDEWISNINWNDFMAFGEYIKDHKQDILTSLEYPIYYDSDSNLFITKLMQNDIPYSAVGDNGVGEIPFESGENRTKAEAIIQGLADAHADGVFTTKALEGTYGSNAFTEQKTIFSIGSSGGTGYNIPTSDAFSVGVCKIPYENNNPIYVNQGPTLALLNNTTNETEGYWRTYYSWEFMKYLTNPDVNAKICVLGSEGYVPVRYSAYETTVYQQFMQDLTDPIAATSDILQNDINGNYIVTPVFVGSAQLRDQVGTILNTVCTQSISVTEAFTNAINNAKTYFH